MRLTKHKKNLQSGFTLVELIVVIALMAIVFGALMNVLRPTNIFFNETEAFKDEVMISAGLTNALGDEVRYSTNVLVLQNYVGVPKISSDGKLDGTGDIEYDAAIMFDNQNVRGSALSDFDANATAARRKGATGQIVTFGLNNIGIDFGTASMLYSEPYYADYSYDFDVTGNLDENGMGYIDFGITMWDYSASGANYDYDELPYESSEFLYLKNVNLLPDDGYNVVVKDFGGSIEDADYVGFERETADASFTAAQKAYYEKDNTDNVHTFIIYFRNVAVSDLPTVTITLSPGEGGATTQQFTVSNGRQCRIVSSVSFPEAGHDTIYADSSEYTLQFVGWKSTTNDVVLNNDELFNYVPTADEEFVAQYLATGLERTVSFTVEGVTTTHTVDYGASVTPPDVTVPTGYDGFVWVPSTTDLSQSVNNVAVEPDSADFDSVTSNMNLVPFFYNNHLVTFVDENDAELHSTTVRTGYDIESYDVPEKSGYTGVWNIVNEDGTLIPYVSSNVRSDMTIKAVYESTVHPSLNSFKIENGYWAQGQIKITNPLSSSISDVKIRITTNKPLSVCNIWGSWGWVAQEVSGNTGTITVPTVNASGDTWVSVAFQPNGTTFTEGETFTILSIEIIS